MVKDEEQLAYDSMKCKKCKDPMLGIFNYDIRENCENCEKGK